MEQEGKFITMNIVIHVNLPGPDGPGEPGDSLTNPIVIMDSPVVSPARYSPISPTYSQPDPLATPEPRYSPSSPIASHLTGTGYD
jgi:hypothetical protein